MLGDRFAFERPAVKVTAQYEGAIVFDLVPVETEESMFGFEIANLQNAIDLGWESGPAAGER